VVCFSFADARPGRRWWWLLVDDGEVDLCLTDPGREVDLVVRASLETMTRVWVGRATIEDALRSGEVRVEGTAALARTFGRWLGVPARGRELAESLQPFGVGGGHPDEDPAATFPRPSA
jgi:hypothetical protein